LCEEIKKVKLFNLTFLSPDAGFAFRSRTSCPLSPGRLRTLPAPSVAPFRFARVLRFKTCFFFQIFPVLNKKSQAFQLDFSVARCRF
jgi:hypothetical protein